MTDDTARVLDALRTALGPSVTVLVARPEAPAACPCVLLLPAAQAPALQARGEVLLTHCVQPVRLVARSVLQAAALAAQAADVLTALGYRLTATAAEPAPPRGLTLRFETWIRDGTAYSRAPGTEAG